MIAGRYEIEGNVGEGGMGRVYRARHTQLGKVFALKVIARAFADDHAARERFMREAKLASEISHPNIVSVVDFGEDPEVGAFMVMELVEGEPLIAHPGKPLAVRRALDILAQLGDVLELIHRHDIVHGDIKADNVLVVVESHGARRRQVVRLLDFGLAHRSHTIEHVVCGTPHYLAPECAQGGPRSAASDLYALGVLGFVMLTGRVPFDGSIVDVLTQHVYSTPPTIASVRGEAVDLAVENLITHLLAKDPADRHKSASALVYEINAVMEMLAYVRRRPSAVLRAENAREAAIQVLFGRSELPQAVIDDTGAITLANAAFAQLVGYAEGAVEGVAIVDTSLVVHVPDLLHAIRVTRRSGKPCERRARVVGDDADTLDLGVWLAPFAEAVHVIVRVSTAVW